MGFKAKSTGSKAPHNLSYPRACRACPLTYENGSFCLLSVIVYISVYHYTVSFKTGTGWFATFTGRLTVKIFGENGDTGDIRFKKWVPMIRGAFADQTEEFLASLSLSNLLKS